MQPNDAQPLEPLPSTSELQQILQGFAKEVSQLGEHEPMNKPFFEAIAALEQLTKRESDKARVEEVDRLGSLFGGGRTVCDIAEALYWRRRELKEQDHE